MSEEQLKAFLEKVKADTSLQEKLKAAADANAVADIAKEAGFSISADDLSVFLKNAPQNQLEELSDEELEGVAGGAVLVASVAAGTAIWGGIWGGLAALSSAASDDN